MSDIKQNRQENDSINNDKANKRKQNYVCLRFTSIIALLIPSRGEGRRL